MHFVFCAHILVILVHVCLIKAEDKSIAFVIDDTGSMSGDIQGAIAGAQQIFYDMLHQDNSITNFVLATFNDPDSALVVDTASEATFLSELQHLTVDGGGDCPEMCMHGIQLAIETVLPRSTIFVFTDASAKDYSMESTIINLIQQKQCQLLYLLTGECNPEDPNDPGRKVYDHTAAASNGQVFNVTTGNVSNVLHWIDANLHDVPIDSVDFSTGASRTLSFPVDMHVDAITVSVSGTAPTYSITNQAGVAATCTGVVDLANAVVVKCADAAQGIWSTTVAASGAFALRITGHGSGDYVYGFSPVADTDRPNYRPLVGTPTYVLNKLSNFSLPQAVARTLKLVQMNGSEIASFPLVYRPGNDYQYLVGPIITPSIEFRMEIEGTDEHGNNFRRVSSTAVTVERNPCVIHPCGDNGTCHQVGLTTNYTCTCNEGYFGFDCSKRDACYFGNPCDNGGTCQTTPTGYQCLCPMHYNGPNCQYDPNAFCNDNGHLSCTCNYGYTGPFCDQTTDFCDVAVGGAGLGSNATFGHICNEHGHCYSYDGIGAQCICDYGFQGPLCEQTVAGESGIAMRCEENNITSCQAEQRCIPDDVNCAFEHCDSPVLGWCLPIEHADKLIADHRDARDAGGLIATIANGTDVCNGVGQPNCTCGKGYTGAQCQSEIDFCLVDVDSLDAEPSAASVCGPNANCTSTINGAICNCSEGWIGDLCNQPDGNLTRIQLRCCLSHPMPSACSSLANRCSADERCLPDDMNCAFADSCHNPIGWCNRKSQVLAVLSAYAIENDKDLGIAKEMMDW